MQDAATSAVYLRARWYQPGTSTLLGVDPDLDSTGQAYAYAAGDPVNGRDPSGLCFAVQGKTVENWPNVGKKGACTSFDYYNISGTHAQPNLLPLTAIEVHALDYAPGEATSLVEEFLGLTGTVASSTGGEVAVSATTLAATGLAGEAVAGAGAITVGGAAMLVGVIALPVGAVIVAIVFGPGGPGACAGEVPAVSLPTPGKKANPKAPATQTPNHSLNQMRVQLQENQQLPGGRGRSAGQVVESSSDLGVTTLQVRTALWLLYKTTPSWFPRNRYGHDLAIARLSVALKRFPPAGIDGGGEVLDEEFPHGRDYYRVDVDNLRGWNLRE